MSNPFFINRGPFDISEILSLLKVNLKIKENHKIKNIKDLVHADKNCITFFHSKKYQKDASETKASYCLTIQNLKNYDSGQT